jgi:hypothetical protein
MTMNLASKFKIVPVLHTADYNGGAVGDSINMGKAYRATFILTFGAITGNAVLYLYSGITAGTLTSPLEFSYALGSADIGSVNADVLAAQAKSSALTLTDATYQNKMLVIEIDTGDMDLANDEEWLTLYISDAAAAGIVHVVAVLEPRYSSGATVLS